MAFYTSACLKPSAKDQLHYVFEIVHRNRAEYDKHSTEIDKAIEDFEQNGPIEDAWVTLAPTTELLRMECIAEREEIHPDELNEQDDVPEFSAQPTLSAGIVPAVDAPQISSAVIREMYQTLKETQASIFYTVRDWCIKRVWPGYGEILLLCYWWCWHWKITSNQVHLQ